MENNKMEDNKKKGRGRPRKVKTADKNVVSSASVSSVIEEVKISTAPDEANEEILLKSNSNSFEPELHEQEFSDKTIDHSFEEDEDIRAFDKPIIERLVQDSINSSERELYDDDDEDFHKALIESMKDKNNLEKELMKESEEEYIFQQIIQQINIEEIEKRSLLLPQFTKRLERLCFSESDRNIRDIITPIIVEYKLNKLNNVYLELDIYDNIYGSFIDTLYKKPINLGKTTTAITKDEDELIRKIFLKKE
jgi:hypothetical protein